MTDPSTSGAVVNGRVRSIQVGTVAPLGPDRVPSGFVKQPIGGSVSVGQLGLAGDEQADLRVHGGPDKAVYGYAFTNYAAWRTQFPAHESRFVPGGLGENLTLDACDESQVCVNDIVRVGSAVLQVTQPRQPCFKFALRFNDETMPRAMMRNGFCGWYYRVLQTGSLQAGDEVVLLERPTPEWSVERVNRLIVQRKGTPAQRAEFAQLMQRAKPAP